MAHYIDELVRTIDDAAAEFRNADAAAAAVRPAPDAWSPKELVGHLIDSASINHQRFMRARWQEDLVFAGYAQDQWVDAQAYQSAPWEDLVTLWEAYNRHIARVMATTPASVLFRAHGRHNFHEIAWRTVPVTATTTLDYFMSDYVGHLQHHVAQIRERLRGGIT